MRPPPNAEAHAPIDQEPYSVRELFEHRIAWAERYGAHHQEAGASGVPHESLIAVVGGGAIAAGGKTLTTRLVHEFGEGGGGCFGFMGGGIFRAVGHDDEGHGALG